MQVFMFLEFLKFGKIIKTTSPIWFEPLKIQKVRFLFKNHNL